MSGILIRKPDWLRRTILLLAMLISGGNLIFPRVPLLIAIIVLYLVYRRWVIGVRHSMLPVLLLLAVILVVTVLRPAGADPLLTLIRYANFFAALLLLDLYLATGPSLLMKDLQVIVRFMVWQALLTVPLAEFFNPLFIPFPVQETPYNTLLGIFNYHVMLEDSSTLIRPDGFFYEPGVLQIYLNLFLYVSLFVFGRRLEGLLAAAAVLLTQSTTGILIACILLSWYGVTRYINRGSLTLRIVKTGVGAVLLGAVALAAAGNFQQKLTGESQGSFAAREYDLITGLNIIVVHPWLGIGFDYDQYLHASAELGYSDVALPERITSDRTNSNGVIQLFYSLGIPLGIPFLFGLFRQRFFPQRLLVGTALLLASLGEAVLFTPFFLMIIFSGLLLPENAARRAVPRSTAAPLGA